MPRLRIRLPKELGTTSEKRGTAPEGGNSRTRALGAGLESADEVTRLVLRWHHCWAKSEE